MTRTNNECESFYDNKLLPAVSDIHGQPYTIVTPDRLRFIADEIVLFLGEVPAHLETKPHGLRLCKYWKDSAYHPAWFHVWAGLSERPLAIIEDENGIVKTHDADFIRFLDTPPLPEEK